MLDELRTRFRTRFIDTARARVRRILILLGNPGNAADLVAELHALAGEAAMLGLDEISETARTGEVAARRWDGGEASAQVRCARVARLLGQQVERFAVTPTGSSEPSAASEEEVGADDGSSTIDTPAAAGSQRVLIVDDSTLVSAELIDTFAEQGISATSASDRAAALQRLSEFRPVLLLVDVHIPNEEVGALCRALRSTAGGPRLDIVLVSGRPSSELAEIANDVAADGYISKQQGSTAVVAYVKQRLLRVRA